MYGGLKYTFYKTANILHYLANTQDDATLNKRIFSEETKTNCGQWYYCMLLWKIYYWRWRNKEKKKDFFFSVAKSLQKKGNDFEPTEASKQNGSAWMADLPNEGRPWLNPLLLSTLSPLPYKNQNLKFNFRSKAVPVPDGCYSKSCNFSIQTPCKFVLINGEMEAMHNYVQNSGSSSYISIRFIILILMWCVLGADVRIFCTRITFSHQQCRQQREELIWVLCSTLRGRVMRTTSDFFPTISPKKIHMTFQL